MLQKQVIIAVVVYLLVPVLSQGMCFVVILKLIFCEIPDFAPIPDGSYLATLPHLDLSSLERVRECRISISETLLETLFVRRTSLDHNPTLFDNLKTNFFEGPPLLASQLN